MGYCTTPPPPNQPVVADHPDVILHENRSFRWDPNSGQFSFSQGQDYLLSRAVHILHHQSTSDPESVAILQGQYQGTNCIEVGISHKNLKNRVDEIANVFDHVADEENKICIIILPVSILAVAAVLASTIVQMRYCLIFTGFSNQALYQLLSTGQVGAIIATHDQHSGIQTLLQNHPQISSPVTVHLDNSDNGFITKLESYHVDPIFAIYTGGPFSLIAGTGEITGYYQVTSNVQPGRYDSNCDDIVKVDTNENEDDLETVEKKFKAEKIKNSFRLDHIRDILDK